MDHVKQYRRPKDEKGEEIIEQGCAPKTPTPSPSSSPTPPPVEVKKLKKKKKDKSKKKERKLKKLAQKLSTGSVSSPVLPMTREDSPGPETDKRQRSLIERRDRERSPVGRRDRERSPVGRRDRERSPVGRRDRERSPVGRRDRERSPVGRRDRERLPISRGDRDRSSLERKQDESSFSSGHSRPDQQLELPLDRKTKPHGGRAVHYRERADGRDESDRVYKYRREHLSRSPKGDYDSEEDDRRNTQRRRDHYRR